MMLPSFNINIPSNFILGLSVFTLFLSLADTTNNKFHKNWITFFSLPVAFGAAVFATYSYKESEINTTINSFTIMSLSMVLVSIFLSDIRKKEKKEE